MFPEGLIILHMEVSSSSKCSHYSCFSPTSPSALSRSHSNWTPNSSSLLSRGKLLFMNSDQAYFPISNTNPPFSHKAFPEDFLASCPCTYWYFSFPKCFGISCISQFMYYLHHLLLLYLNITEDGDYNEIKRLLLLGRKAMTDLDSTLKSRDIILLTKICKVIVFPVVSYGCKSWTIKNAEYWRIDAFELWCWRRWLRVPWTARRLKKSILKEISPE